MNFYRRATGCWLFQSTPSVWRETEQTALNGALNGISIHSLRVEGDSAHTETSLHIAISIHSLRVEGDRFTVVNI